MSLYFRSSFAHPPTLLEQALHSELLWATLDKDVDPSVALKGPVGGSLAFTLFPALGQNPVEQARGSVCLRLGGHRLSLRDRGPPHQKGALATTLAPFQHRSATSSAPPPKGLQNVSTGGQRGNNKHKGPVYSS